MTQKTDTLEIIDRVVIALDRVIKLLQQMVKEDKL